MKVLKLVKINIINREDVIDSCHVKVKKAYPAYFGSYKQINKVIDYVNSLDNLYCIGRNGQHRYNNMDHSMLTGIEAVKVIAGKSEREVLWNINAEQEYHESK